MKNLPEITDMKIIFAPSILKRLDLNENILQNADIFTAKEIIKMQISYHSLRRDYSQNREI